MKRLVVYIAVISAFVLTNCKKDPVSPVATVFFPMEIGNTWNYESHPNSFSHSEMTVEIVGTRTIGEHTYFIFETSFPGLPGQSEDRFFRQDKDGKVFINWQGADFLYIDFDRDIHDGWDSWASYVGVIREKEKTLEVSAGRFTNTTEVFFDIEMAADEEFCETYAKGVGRLNISCLFGIPMQLISATIGGVTISN